MSTPGKFTATDLVNAASALQAATHTGRTEGGSGWTPLDLADTWLALDEGRDLTPEAGVLYRQDGEGLLYPGSTHWISGEPESLKTWICFVAAVQVLAAGERVVWVDLEDSPQTAVQRLTALGITAEQRDRFLYIAPDRPLMTSQGVDALQWQALRDLCVTQAPALVVIDSVGELSSLNGLATESGDDMTRQGGVFKELVQDCPSAALIAIDHVAKDTTGRGRWAIGSQAKLAGITGAALSATMTEPFGIGQTGRCVLSVTKDRRGGLRRIAAPAATSVQPVAEVVLVSDEDTGAIEWSVEVPDVEGDHFRPSGVMESVSLLLEETEDGMTGPEIQKEIGCAKLTRREAIRLLVDEGHVRVEGAGRGTRYFYVVAFRSAGDPAMTGEVD